MRARCGRRGLLAMALVASVWTLVRTVPAVAVEPVPLRRTGVDAVNGWLTVSVGLSDLLTAEARKKLRSGFSTRVLLRVYLYQDGFTDPVATAFRQSEIVWDIWDERFHVQTVDSFGGKRAVITSSEDEAIAESTGLRHFAVVELNALPSAVPFRVGVRGDLNPLSQERLADVRRWMLRPPGQRGGGGDSVFGSFVSVFVNPRIEESERQVRFLSQVFALPPPVTR